MAAGFLFSLVDDATQLALRTQRKAGPNRIWSEVIAKLHFGIQTFSSFPESRDGPFPEKAFTPMTMVRSAQFAPQPIGFAADFPVEFDPTWRHIGIAQQSER